MAHDPSSPPKFLVPETGTGNFARVPCILVRDFFSRRTDRPAGRTDGRTKRRARPVMRPIMTAADTRNDMNNSRLVNVRSNRAHIANDCQSALTNKLVDETSCCCWRNIAFCSQVERK